jgi:predicted phage terminase large subunit-like protein
LSVQQSYLEARDNLKRLIDAEKSLHAFVKLAWPQIEGNKPFIDGWHIQTICEHLEACIRGEIKTLLINCPPRMTKTSLITIMFPAWVWIKMPWIKFMYASYSQPISWEHSRLCKMLIESAWYQQNWGHSVQLSKDQSTKGHFANTELGYRIATSINGMATGLGGDCLVGDDLNNASDGQSQVTREFVNDFLSRTWSTRLNPGGLGINIMTSQRVHEMDASGFWLSRDENNKIVKLILPMEYESRRACKTIVLPSTNGKRWEDPRKTEGELLCPSYKGIEDIKEQKLILGTYNYAGQYQQRPAPESGGLIRRDWFQVWSKEKLPKLTYVIQSWDTALTMHDESAYSACTTWGLFKLQGVVNVMLLTAWRARISYVDLVKWAARLYGNYLDIVADEPIGEDYKRTPDRLLIEAKASGLPVVSDLISKGIPASSFLPDEFGDKIQRVHLVTPYIECGRVWVCSEVGTDKLYTDHEMFISECELFPKGEYRDMVDTMTQAFLYMTKKAKLLQHVMNPRFEREQKDLDS